MLETVPSSISLEAGESEFPVLHWLCYCASKSGGLVKNLIVIKRLVGLVGREIMHLNSAPFFPGFRLGIKGLTNERNLASFDIHSFPKYHQY